MSSDAKHPTCLESLIPHYLPGRMDSVGCLSREAEERDAPSELLY